MSVLSGRYYGSRESRPHLWPPSHSEIVAELEGEKLSPSVAGELTNPIPGWSRGPLLKQTSGGHADLLGAPSMPARSRSSDEGNKRKPLAVGMVSGTKSPTAKTGEIDASMVGGGVRERTVSYILIFCGYICINGKSISDRVLLLCT